MDIDWRTGMDKLNENVHNFLVNILARGGLVQVFLFLLFSITQLAIKLNTVTLLKFYIL